MKEKTKKIFFIATTTIIICLLIFLPRFSKEDKIGISIGVLIVAIFSYIENFSEKFQKFKKTKTAKKIKKIFFIFIWIFLGILSIISIKNYILTKIIAQLILGIFFIILIVASMLSFFKKI